MANTVGIPFVKGGRDSEQGVDCWGLVMLVYKEHYGTDIPDFTDIDGFLDEGDWECIPEPKDEDVPLVALMASYPDCIIHAGIFIGNNRVIHTMEQTNSIISRVDLLKEHIIGYYRYIQSNKHT